MAITHSIKSIAELLMYQFMREVGGRVTVNTHLSANSVSVSGGGKNLNTCVQVQTVLMQDTFLNC